MATKKNEEKKSLKFIDVLNDFREGKEVEFSNFIEDVSIQELMIILDKVFVQFAILDKQIKDEVQYEIERQRVIFFYCLNHIFLLNQILFEAVFYLGYLFF